jgi:hypothetical protein
MSKKIMNFLEQAYNKEKYLSFLKEKFNFSELLEPIEITPNDVKSDVKSFKQLGSVAVEDDKKLPVFEIYPCCRLVLKNSLFF